jgi:hypothetical protein
MEPTLPPDRKAIACNFLEATKIATQGAKAYLVNPNPGWGNERVTVLARSRGGRWVQKWENTRRLGNFRVVTICPQDPLYRFEQIEVRNVSPELLAELNAWGKSQIVPPAEVK